MLIYKITFIISGDNFNPSNIKSKLSDELYLIDSHSPTDSNEFNGQEYGLGVCYFMHPSKFAVLGEDSSYEEDFVTFLEKNYSFFEKEGAAQIEFSTDIFYSGPQCNFEIFNKALLNRLNVFQNIAYPISVFKMSDKAIKELLANKDL